VEDATGVTALFPLLLNGGGNIDGFAGFESPGKRFLSFDDEAS
jgi:hypothetical protein